MNHANPSYLAPAYVLHAANDLSRLLCRSGFHNAGASACDVTAINILVGIVVYSPSAGFDHLWLHLASFFPILTTSIAYENQNGIKELLKISLRIAVSEIHTLGAVSLRTLPPGAKEERLYS